MSRAGYTDDLDDNWAWVCWRGAVKSAMRGKRGQAFLIELRGSLEAMEVKELVSGAFEAKGQHCTLGVIGHARGIDLEILKPETNYEWDEWDWESIAKTFGIAEAMAREIMFMNDEPAWLETTPSKRWESMHQWITTQIV